MNPLFADQTEGSSELPINPPHAPWRTGKPQPWCSAMNANSSGLHFTSSLALPRVSPDRLCSYTELQKQIHTDLRLQHPEWIEPNGECPICDSYERRLAELIGFFTSAERNSIT